MPWPSASNRKYRVAVTWTISGTNPPKVDLGPEFADLWSGVQSDGYDLLACDASGKTVAHQRITWSYANKGATIQITCPSGLPASATVGVVYLYWGADATVSVDPSTTVSGTATPGFAVPPGGLPGVSLEGSAVIPEGNGYTASASILAPVGGITLAVAPVALALADVSIRGGRELEDVEGLRVEVLDADASGAPASPGTWVAGVRLAWSADRGAAILAAVAPATAELGLLRLRAWTTGPQSGGLLDRAPTTYALLQGVTPTE